MPCPAIHRSISTLPTGQRIRWRSAVTLEAMIRPNFIRGIDAGYRDDANADNYWSHTCLILKVLAHELEFTRLGRAGILPVLPRKHEADLLTEPDYQRHYLIIKKVMIHKLRTQVSSFAGSIRTFLVISHLFWPCSKIDSCDSSFHFVWPPAFSKANVIVP